MGSQLQSKSRFNAEYIRLSDSLVHEQLLCHGELRLCSWPEDYGEMWVYSRSSSSGEMSYVKEETYCIARSFGVASNSRVIANVDHHMIGLLPSKAVADFVNACAGSFTTRRLKRGPSKGA